MIVVSDTSHRGHLAAVRPVLDKLLETAGFWVSGNLRRRVLEAAGEK